MGQAREPGGVGSSAGKAWSGSGKSSIARRGASVCALQRTGRSYRCGDSGWAVSVILLAFLGPSITCLGYIALGWAALSIPKATREQH